MTMTAQDVLGEVSMTLSRLFQDEATTGIQTNYDDIRGLLFMRTILGWLLQGRVLPEELTMESQHKLVLQYIESPQLMEQVIKWNATLTPMFQQPGAA